MRDDLLPTFIRSAEAVGCCVDILETIQEAGSKVIETLQAYSAKVVWRWSTPILESLKLEKKLLETGIISVKGGEKESPFGTPMWKQADAGITEVDYGIAETGTLVLGTGADRPRSISLLPPVHLAFLPVSRILPSLKDFFQRNPLNLKAESFFFITGPSRTADIEQTLTLGVHGPRKVHILLLLYAS